MTNATVNPAITTDRTYTWDWSNRLTKVGNDTEQEAVYAYDGFSQRVEGIEICPSCWYGTRQTFYAYYGGLRVAKATGMTADAVTTYYYHIDALGSTRLLTDSNKNVVFSDNYQPCGQDNSSSGTENYKFTGSPIVPQPASTTIITVGTTPLSVDSYLSTLRLEAYRTPRA